MAKQKKITKKVGHGESGNKGRKKMNGKIMIRVRKKAEKRYQKYFRLIQGFGSTSCVAIQSKWHGRMFGIQHKHDMRILSCLLQLSVNISCPLRNPLWAWEGENSTLHQTWSVEWSLPLASQGNFGWSIVTMTQQKILKTDSTASKKQSIKSP